MDDDELIPASVAQLPETERRVVRKAIRLFRRQMKIRNGRGHQNVAATPSPCDVLHEVARDEKHWVALATVVLDVIEQDPKLKLKLRGDEHRRRCSLPSTARRKGGQMANHNRYHVARGISNPKRCALCREAELE